MQFETQRGTRKVISYSNDGSRWSSRLYVNDGETATSITAKHKSRKGAEAWASKVLAG